MNAVATKLYWWEDQPEEIPAERVHETEETARKWAAQRSNEVRGRVELCLGPKLPPFATYRAGVDIQAAPELIEA